MAMEDSIYLLMQRRRVRSRSRSRGSRKKDSSPSSESSQGAHASLKAGDMLGKYQVTRLISDGTFGRVVEATYNSQQFAIKVPPSLGHQE
jgi:hypothetical protein